MGLRDRFRGLLLRGGQALIQASAQSVQLPVQSAPPGLLRTRAGQNYPYDAGGMGRRAQGWQTTRLGVNTLLWGNLDQVRSRSRDAVRNNAWANSAIDKFESNVVGTGIQPHWQHSNPRISAKIQDAWNRWQRDADWGGQASFYGLQAQMAREIFEAGEVFVRYRLRPPKDKLFIPLQLQLIEGEQLPVFRNIISGGSGATNTQFPDNSMAGIGILDGSHSVRNGIEMDADYRRIAYHFYKEHPGESMFWPDAYQFVSIPASDVRHIYRPVRAGQLRGEPRMTSVLALLYELEEYTDASLVKKKLASMLTAFIEKQPDTDIFPPAGDGSSPENVESPSTSSSSFDAGIQAAKLEPGTMQELWPGEKISFPQVPSEADFEPFMRIQLHKLASGCGLTHAQLTGDLRGVNYSSIRAGLLEFRKSCEQFQYLVLVQQGCDPIARRWLDEAVLSGRLSLPGYFTNPWQYQQIAWVAPGWDWIDPLKEAQAAQLDVRNGFTSRQIVVRGKGLDPAIIDAQQQQDRDWQDKNDVVYDSNPSKILIGRESQPPIEEEAVGVKDKQGEEEGEAENDG